MVHWPASHQGSVYRSAEFKTGLILPSTSTPRPAHGHMARIAVPLQGLWRQRTVAFVKWLVQWPASRPPRVLKQKPGWGTIYFYYLLVTSVGGQCCVWSGLAASCVPPLAHALPSNPGPDSPRRPPPSHPGVFLNRKGPCPPPPRVRPGSTFSPGCGPLLCGVGSAELLQFFLGKEGQKQQKFLRDFWFFHCIYHWLA